MAEKKYIDDNALLYIWQKLKTLFAGKVDTEEGKGLSTNDYTNEEKTKLASLENYELPIATSSTLGGIKAGAGVEVTADGTLNATGGTADSVDWSNVQNKPTNVSEFTNDAGYQTASDVSSAISTATEGLATETYVTEQLANYNKKQVVTSTSEMTDENTIYLIANSGSGNNVYDEYIVVSGTPEKIGTTEIDLTNYVQESDLVAITNAEIDSIFET